MPAFLILLLNLAVQYGPEMVALVKQAIDLFKAKGQIPASDLAAIDAALLKAHQDLQNAHARP